MFDYIKEHSGVFVTLFIPAFAAISYTIAYFYYYLRFSYLGLPLSQIQPSFFQTLWIVGVCIISLLCTLIFTKMFVYVVGKIESSLIIWAGIILACIVLFFVYKYDANLFNFSENNPTFLLSMFGGGAIILSVLLKDQLKNYFFIGIIFSIFIICLSLIMDLTISDLSQKKDYLKMKDTNYLLVESMGQKDYYKEYDFGNKTFKDNFLFVPSNAEVELEGVRID